MVVALAGLFAIAIYTCCIPIAHCGRTVAERHLQITVSAFKVLMRFLASALAMLLMGYALWAGVALWSGNLTPPNNASTLALAFSAMFVVQFLARVSGIFGSADARDDCE